MDAYTPHGRLKMPRIIWTQEDDAKLAELHKRGYSASQIANRFVGRSRNSIIGRLYGILAPRIGPPTITKPPEARKDGYTPDEIELLKSGLSDLQVADKIGRSAKSVHNKRCTLGLHRVARERLPHNPSTRANGQVMNAAVRQIAPIEPRGDKPTLMQLKAGDCKYPYGDPRHPEFSYCGLPAPEGFSYCNYHQQVCYQRSVR